MDRIARQRGAWWVAAAIVLVVTAGCGLTGHQQVTAGPAQPVVQTTEATPEPEPTTEATVQSTPTHTTAAPTRSPSKKPVRKPIAKATTAPTEDPNNYQVPACSHYDGKNIAKVTAKVALVKAAGRIYWPTSAPSIRIPVKLVKAVAWHESGWQSAIVNCDGGRGLMQVMPDTAATMNQRFEQTYDATNYQDNAYLGANYLAWLTRWFGDHHFHATYDLSPATCHGTSDPCLLNMVIAGYNAGFGAVDAAYEQQRLPNPEYVGIVRALMKKCFCDRY